MGAEVEVLEKLLKELRNKGVSPLPATSFLLEKITSKVERKQLADEHSTTELLGFESVNFSSVCFAKSDDIQEQYRSEVESLRKIDEIIDQLIKSSPS